MQAIPQHLRHPLLQHGSRRLMHAAAASESRSSRRSSSIAAAAGAAAVDAVPEQQQGSAEDSVAADGSKKVKRNVALHVGYVGTHYTGLQANRQLPELATVEGVLEKAVFAAGMITAANYGDFRKTKWSRSSRTDKGVHSLATVIGLRVLMHDEDYETDPEGIKYAQAINEHLPDDVCVFAVQRTNKSFNARRWCQNRTYEYYLPASLLGLATPDGSSVGDQAKLALLRDVLQAYCGYLPYHNFAGQRSQYVQQRAKAQRRKQRREARAAAEASTDGALTSLEGDSAPTVLDAQQQPPPPAPTPPEEAAVAVAAQGDDSEQSDAEAAAEAALYAAAAAAYTGEGPVPPELQWQQQVYFLDAPDAADPVVKSHYRMIRSFSADDPAPLVPGGVPCLRLEVCGDSFMLHQIRNMVGAAVAIVRGVMPRELLEVALSAPGRVTLPRAPPHSLLLYGSTFSSFPAGWGLDTPLVARYTGERLMLRERGQAMRQHFRTQVFNSAINELLQHPDWELWSRSMLPRYVYPDAQDAVAAHAAWRGALQAKRAAKAAAAAEAQAVAAAVAVVAVAAAARRVPQE